MSVVSALRTLWRFRLLTALFALVAIIAGLAMSYHIQLPGKLVSRQYYVGVGTAQALVDTPRSQIVDLGGAEGSTADIATLSARASLLASLMTSSPIKEEIARGAGVRPDKLLAVPPASADPATAGSVATGTTVTADDPKANILKTTVPELQSGHIPIILIQTQAPDARTAARLADRAVAALQSHLENVAVTDDVPDRRRVAVRKLGPATAALESRGPGKAMAIVVSLFVFLGACGTLLGVLALRKAWQQTDEDEDETEAPFDLEAEGPLDPNAPVLDAEPEPVEYRHAANV